MNACKKTFLSILILTFAYTSVLPHGLDRDEWNRIMAAIRTQELAKQEQLRESRSLGEDLVIKSFK